MPHRRTADEPDRTPHAGLAEGPLHGIVGYQIAQAQVITDAVFDEAVQLPDGLRRLEFSVLCLVQANADVSARQLARALNVTPPHIAISLDRLEARGLVERRRSTADARVQHLRLTRQGATFVQAGVARVQVGEAAALSTLSPAERAMLLELLHKVARGRLGKTPS
jgi:DNA-binding MarR family transcriptional regulator